MQLQLTWKPPADLAQIFRKNAIVKKILAILVLGVVDHFETVVVIANFRCPISIFWVRTVAKKEKKNSECASPLFTCRAVILLVF